MSDPAVDLQNAVETVLRNDTALIAAFGGTVRLYTLAAPNAAPFPYLVIGDDQIVGDGTATDCGQADDVTVPVQVWARGDEPADGRLQAKAIAGAVRAALNTEIEVDGHRVVDWSFETTRHLTDQDGLTANSVVTVSYHIEPAA